MEKEKSQESYREDRFIILRRDVLARKDLSASEKLVYARICGFSEYFESKEQCAEVLGIGVNTVVKAKQKLVRSGFIREIADSGRGKTYQAIYDSLAKSAKQVGKKLPSRLADSATIEEIEKKDIITTKVVIGETPETYGKSEINEVFAFWKETVGYEISAKSQANRYACSNLIKKHGVHGLKQLIRGVALTQSDKFAPRISDFSQLQAKLNELLAWGRRQSTTKGTIKI